ncbi:hypothetical protein EI94DRAFT_1720892 [Lactarius quietus]|nr:hypothetical protein EI94DRAFT_1720892 [Lactarius quietus]
MVVDSSMAAPTGRHIPDDALTFIASTLGSLSKYWDDDNSDTAFIRALSTIYYDVVHASMPSHESLVNFDQFKKNAAKMGTSGFTDLLRKARGKTELSLWLPVVTHDIFHTAIPDDPDHDLDESQVPPELQEEATMRSWETPFIGTRSLLALKRHVVGVASNSLSYGPYCSIVQSSGMGKSRLVDEFAKTNFLIPLNLREGSSNEGFPPPDVVIRDLLTAVGRSENMIYPRMLHFLFELLEKTSSVIADDLKGPTTRSQCIVAFREFMTIGQNSKGAGEKRQKFYDEIAAAVETRIRIRKGIKAEEVRGALDKLISLLGPRPQTNDCPAELPHVFIAFDEAHPLANITSTERRTHFTELRSAIKDVNNVSFFFFFLSTTSKISKLSMPKDIAESARMQEDYMPSLPFSDLGFDHLMHDRKIFHKYKTIHDVTTTECVVHMGRPLWGTMYDSGVDRVRGSIIRFAAMKLLGSDIYGNLSFTADQHCAVLSQRLALEINSSSYVTSGSTRNYDMSEKAQFQISNHMRVCLSIPKDLASVRALAASEPILSEAASLIMRTSSSFSLPDALLNVLDAYAISHGERGELLVSAFFTRARDLLVQQLNRSRVPSEPTQFCYVFSVSDLLSNLFRPAQFKTMARSLPSVHRPDFSPQEFADVFKNTKMHFNHMIHPFGIKTISRLYLLRIMARGAAALGANCQPGYDMVYPFLYDTSDLVVKKVGFIMVQVKNYANTKKAKPKIFWKMDPVLCGLLKKANSEHFTVPIIRIVFSLGGKKPSLKHVTYKSPTHAAATLDRRGRPKFTSYDFWCSGIGPDLLQPVYECNPNVQTKWNELLGKTDKFHTVFSQSKAPDVRRSQYPGGGLDMGHYNAWMGDGVEDETETEETETEDEDEDETEDETDGEPEE